MSRPINAQTWHRLTTSSSVRGNLMDWPDKGGHKGRPYHAIRGCRIVRAALVAALPGRIPRTEY